MIVRNEQQALCVAVEMERRAIRVYERALMLARDEEVRKGIREILADEKEHFRRFTAMKEACAGDANEERMLMQAMAAEMLFPGGVMELERARAWTPCRAFMHLLPKANRTLWITICPLQKNAAIPRWPRPSPASLRRKLSTWRS